MKLTVAINSLITELRNCEPTRQEDPHIYRALKQRPAEGSDFFAPPRRQLAPSAPTYHALAERSADFEGLFIAPHRPAGAEVAYRALTERPERPDDFDGLFCPARPRGAEMPCTYRALTDRPEDFPGLFATPRRAIEAEPAYRALTERPADCERPFATARREHLELEPTYMALKERPGDSTADRAGNTKRTSVNGNPPTKVDPIAA